MSRRRANLLTALVATLTILVTWGVRRYVEAHLDYGVPVPVLGDVFRLTRGENTGVAFSLLRDSPLVPWLSALALVAVASSLGRAVHGRPAGAGAVGLILSGGAANLLDRRGDGRVTDYLDWGIGAWRYATFNLPDTAIWVSLRVPAAPPAAPTPTPRLLTQGE